MLNAIEHTYEAMIIILSGINKKAHLLDCISPFFDLTKTIVNKLIREIAVQIRNRTTSLLLVYTLLCTDNKSAIPRIVKLNRFDPVISPNAASKFCFLINVKQETNSGKDVATPSKIAPATVFQRPNFSATMYVT